jgi:hypothetical protein
VAAGLVRLVVRARHGTAELVEARVAAEIDRRYALDAERWPVQGLRAAERAEQRAERAAWLRAARERGELLDTNGVLLTHGVRGELARRGWDTDWPPAPVGVDLGGRWWGSMETGYPDRVTCSLPVGLVDQVRAACWWTSKNAIAGLMAWRDEHPGPVPRYGLARERYERLAAEVTVPGEIWRAGLDAVVRPGQGPRRRAASPRAEGDERRGT